MILYKNDNCPLCVEVEQHIKRLNKTVEIRDTRISEEAREQLKKDSTIYRVPCLVTNEGKALHRFQEILAYLEDRPYENKEEPLFKF